MFKLAGLIVLRLLISIALLIGASCDVAQAFSTFDHSSIHGSVAAPRRNMMGSTPAPGPPTPLIRDTPWRPPVVNIKYFGGPVMSDPIKLYFIWYGDWPESYKAVVRTVCLSLTPPEPIQEFPNLANWWKIVTQYTSQLDGPKGSTLHVSDSVSIGGEIDDFYSQGKNLTNAISVPLILKQAKLKLPRDKSTTDLGALYVVFAAGDVSLSDVSGACGFHSALGSYPTDLTLYAYLILSSIENQLISECNLYNTDHALYYALPGLPPNGHVDPSGSLDSMLSSLLHEIAEAASDPAPIIGWQVDSGSTENGDMCAYVFGGGDYQYCNLDPYGPVHNESSVCGSYPFTSQVLQQGRKKKQADSVIYNLYGVNGSQFLIQQMWSISNKGCQLQLQEPCKGTVHLSSAKGHIQVGVFKDGKGLQRYAPGENCEWKISVPKAKNLTLNFENVATGYDRLDHIDVFEMQAFSNGSRYANNTLEESSVPLLKISISEPKLDQDLKVHIEGSEATIQFISYGGRSPYAEATGFQLSYKAAF